VTLPVQYLGGNVDIKSGNEFDKTAVKIKMSGDTFTVDPGVIDQ